MPPEVETNQAQVIQLAPGDLALIEHISLFYDAVIPVDVAPEELLKPAFWAHHAVKLQPMNEIRARCLDGTWMARYVVLDCGRTWAKVHLLHHYALTTPDVSETVANEEDIKKHIAEHSVVHRGPNKKWCVMRISDKRLLIEELGTKDEAHDWLARYARKMLTPGLSQEDALAATVS